MWEFNKHEKKEFHERINKFNSLKEWVIFKAKNTNNEEKTFIVIEKIKQGVLNVLEINNWSINNIIQSIPLKLKKISVNDVKDINSIMQTIIKND